KLWAEAKAKAGPSFEEIKIAEIGKEMSELEVRREKAMEEGDMALYKALNKDVRQKRKEIEKYSEKMNTTAVVNVEQKTGAWEQFSEGLRSTPLLKGILGLGETKAAKKFTDAAEDARETWETSQNPLIYNLHGVWDSMFAETEMGEAIREFRKMDPS